MKEITTVVFDFGGVLVDWNPRYLYRNVFDSEEEMEYFLGNICTEAWNMEQDAGRSLKEGTEVLVQQYPEHEPLIRRYYDEWELMIRDEIHENTRLIQPLKEQGYRVLGLTNWSAETLPIAKQQFDFFDALEGMVVSGEEKVVKPDERIYQILIKRFGILPQNSLFIDDNINNIHAANSIGFQTIHVKDTDFSLESELKQLKML